MLFDYNSFYLTFPLGFINKYYIMLKAFVLFATVTFSFYTITFLSRYVSYKISLKQFEKITDDDLTKFVIKFSTNLTNSQKLKQINYNESHPVIKQLASLIQLPLVGQFFMDDKIYQLARIQNWKGIVQQSPQIINTLANKYNFQVWYHKALAQCSLGLLDKCQDSVKSLEVLAGNKYHDLYAQSIINYYQGLKRKQTLKIENGIFNSMRYTNNSDDQILFDL